MTLTRRHLSSRLAPIFLAAVSMLVGAVLVAAVVHAGASNKTVVSDPASSIEPGCDIRRATSKLTDEGRLRHTITVQQATGDISVHLVTIYGGRSGGADLSLSDGAQGVDARLANQGRSVVFTVGRGRVRQAVDSQRRYFWVARSCTNPGDRAPNSGHRARQSL